MQVADVMTRDVVSVTPDTPVRQAARLIIENQISGLPVVEKGTVTGVISEADLLSNRSARTWFARFLGEGDEPGLQAALTVSELMSEPAITILDTAQVAEAARLMTRRGINRLPVVTADGALVGIVTRADLVRAYVRSDEEIAADARHTLALLPAPLSSVDLEVADGVLFLTGEVEADVEAKALVRILGAVEGVARIENRLKWEVTAEKGDTRWAGYPLEGAEA